MFDTEDGKPQCLYLPREGKRDADGKLHFYPSLVVFQERGHSPTDWDYGTDRRLAEQAVASYNERVGMKPEAVSLIVASSMFPGNRVPLAMVYEANGEPAPPASAYV